MGRKKIEKAPKAPKAQQPEQSDEEPAQQPVPEPQPQKVEPASKPSKGGRKGKGKQTSAKHQDQDEGSKQVQLFTEDFNKRIDDFKSFYSQYLQIRASSSNVNASEEYKKVSDSVRRKIQAACSKVLREDVAEAQKWIENQQAGINDQIKSVQKAGDDLINVLKKSGNFTEAQINAHLTSISKKKQALQQNLNNLQQIKQRAVNTYKSESGMDEQ